MKKSKIYEINKSKKTAYDYYLDYGIINTTTHKQISIFDG